MTYSTSYIIFSDKKNLLCLGIMIHSFISVVRSCPTLGDPMYRSTPGFPGPQLHNSQSLLKPVSTELVILSNHVILCCSLPMFKISQHQGHFQWVSSLHKVSQVLWVLPMNIQHWFPLNSLVWFPCYPRDSQESSPIPQFKNISSSALSFLYSPTLTSIYDYWKSHRFDQTDLSPKVMSLFF